MNNLVKLFFENSILIHDDKYFYFNDGFTYELINDDHKYLTNVINSVNYNDHYNLFCNYKKMDILKYDYLSIKKNIIYNYNHHQINHHFIFYNNKIYYVKDNYLIILSDQNIKSYLKTNLIFYIDEKTFNKFIILVDENIYSYCIFLEKYIFYNSDSNIIEQNINKYKELFTFLNKKTIKMSDIKSLTFKKNRYNYPIYQYEHFKFSFWVYDHDIILLPQNILIAYFRKYKYTFDLELIIYFLLRTNIHTIILDDDINYNLLYWTDKFDQKLMKNLISNYEDISLQQKLYQTYIENYNNLYNTFQYNTFQYNPYSEHNDICICLHIGNIYLAYDLYRYIIQINSNFDLFITIDKNLKSSYLFEQFMEKIKLITNAITILEVDNYGADIYPFLYTLKYFACNFNKYNNKYKYLLKLHTKTENIRRHKMIEPMVSQSIEKIIEQIEINGIYGFTYIKYDYLNHDYLLQILNKLDFNNQITYFNQNLINCDHRIINKIFIQKNYVYNSQNNIDFDFVPGTVFWTKFDLIMSEPFIYNLCDDVKVEFHKDYFFQQIPHAIERLFGIYRYNYLKEKEKENKIQL